MIYKRIMLLVLLASLGACANISSLMGSKAPTKTKTSESEQVPSNPQAANNAELAKPLSKEAQLVQGLYAQPNLYTQTKRELSPSAKAKTVAALKWLNEGEVEKSQQAINYVLQTELNINSAVLVLAGDIAQANEKPIAATAHYKKALSLNKHNVKAANRLAKQHRENGQFRQAETLYKQAIEAQPTIPESYRNRAILYDLYLNKKAHALADYEVYSALLKHELQAQENASASVTSASNKATIKALNKNIKLVSRWLVDVGRQVTALEKASNKTVGGN